MRLKAGVKFGDSTMAICFAAMVIDSIYNDYNYDCVITSVNDSKHGTNSLHFKNCAFDVRTKNILVPEHKDKIFEAIKASLTAEFDIIFESRNKDNEHIHLELDPQ